VYLAPAVRAGLDRLAERREVHTGKKTRRSDVIREALLEYLQKHLPESEV
jgi:Arc/MetJ-type ribon-helix-helix transcriptional regulator